MKWSPTCMNELLRLYSIPPHHRPEFAMNEKYTYYQVMFETPDRILFEIVYMGPLQKI